MRKDSLVALFISLTCTPLLFAQDAPAEKAAPLAMPAAPVAITQAPMMAVDCCCPCEPCCDSCCGPRLWVSAEYLLWWIKDGPFPVPLATTGSATDPTPGALGQPGTTVLFGGSNVDF